MPVAHHSFLQHAKPGACIADNKVFPKGARLLQVWNDHKGVDGQTQGQTDGGALMARVGVPAEPLEYVAWAVKLVHPDLQRVKLSAQLEKAISMCGPGKSVELRGDRIQWTKLMVHLMEETKSTEEELVGISPQIS